MDGVTETKDIKVLFLRYRLIYGQEQELPNFRAPKKQDTPIQHQEVIQKILNIYFEYIFPLWLVTKAMSI